MNRDVFDDIKLPLAEITFHDDAYEGRTYVTVEWGAIPGVETKGFKFIMDSAIIDRMMFGRK